MMPSRLGSLRDRARERKAEILKLLDRWQRRDAVGRLPEYCDVAVYYLRKKLAGAKP